MKQSDKKIAITGGIGSGKSTVSELIRGCGYPVFSCDEIYSQLLADRHFVDKLANVFGSGIQRGDGSLDRSALSAVVFRDGEKLKKLNNITHPAIFEKMFALAEGKGTSFFEVPLLFEGGYGKLFDGVIVVLRDREKRIEAVERRDGLTREQVVARMRNQYDYDSADFSGCHVIHNDGDLKNLSEQVHKTLEEIVIKNK